MQPWRPPTPEEMAAQERAQRELSQQLQRAYQPRPDPDTLGAVIRAKRALCKLGLRELAREVGVSAAFLSDIELERRTPSDDVLERICRSLTLDFDAMRALTGRLSAEHLRYLREHPTAGALVRKVAEGGLSDGDIRMLLELVERLAGGRSDA